MATTTTSDYTVLYKIPYSVYVSFMKKDSEMLKKALGEQFEGRFETKTVSSLEYDLKQSRVFRFKQHMIKDFEAILST